MDSRSSNKPAFSISKIKLSALETEIGELCWDDNFRAYTKGERVCPGMRMLVPLKPLTSHIIIIPNEAPWECNRPYAEFNSVLLELSTATKVIAWQRIK